MKAFEYTITDPVGLHARPAANLARFTASCSSEIRVCKKGVQKDADAKSMLGIITLGVRTGDAVVFTVSGDAEEEDLEKLKAFCAAEL